MTVAELIEKLQSMPVDAVVTTREYLVDEDEFQYNDIIRAMLDGSLVVLCLPTK